MGVRVSSIRGAETLLKVSLLGNMVGTVFSGSGILPRYGAGFGISLLLGTRNSPNFGYGMQDFFARLSGDSEIVMTYINVLAAKAIQLVAR